MKPDGRILGPVIAASILALLICCTSCHEGGTKSDGIDGEQEPRPPVEARAEAFGLFYREQTERILLAFNRFAVADDAVPATVFGKHAIAREGNIFEVVPGPNDNNAIGYSVFTTYQAYKVFRSRDLALSLIRLFEGLVFFEAVSGHPGITSREVLPGWTRVMDGVNGTIERTAGGVPVTPPVAYPEDLEAEILETFYDGVVFTYRENPLEYYYNFKAVNEIGDFAHTFVFSQPPDYLTISNCCSSWMITKTGPWEGAFWGNHNSRDNFSDLAFGYLAAWECSEDPEADADVRASAARAWEAGRRIGDNIVDHGMTIMTVGEAGGYDELIPSGEVRPDGETEWQDLGSMASCQMAYLAQAISSEGLDWPPPAIPLPGSIEHEYLADLFEQLGIILPLPERHCFCLNGAYLGKSWGDLLQMEILGFPWIEVAEVLSCFVPDLFPNLFGGMMDDFNELELGAAGVCYYARLAGKPDLYDSARDALSELLDVHRILAELVYDILIDDDRSAWMVEISMDGRVNDPRPAMIKDSGEQLYTAAVLARMFGIEASEEHFEDFALGTSRNAWIEGQLARPDTVPWPLLTDDQIEARIEESLARKEPWIVDRYREAYPDGPPVRRAGDGYEAIGPDGEWMATENPRHEWFGAFKLWFEIPLCLFDPFTLDCSWALLGCSAADIDGSGLADEADRTLFNDAWEEYGEGARCTESNAWCDGADLDRSGRLDTEDRFFMEAAQGCWY